MTTNHESNRHHESTSGPVRPTGLDGPSHAEQIAAFVEAVIASNEVDTGVVDAPGEAYAQLALFGGRQGIHVETVDRDRWQSGHMTTEQVKRLAALGFDRGQQNFVIELPVEADTPAKVGELLESALHGGYDIDPEATLEFSALRSEEPGQ